jgi:hypothetical protein
VSLAAKAFDDLGTECFDQEILVKVGC